MTIPQHFLSFAAVTIDTKHLPLPRPSKPQTPSLQSPLFILILLSPCPSPTSPHGFSSRLRLDLEPLQRTKHRPSSRNDLLLCGQSARANRSMPNPPSPPKSQQRLSDPRRLGTEKPAFRRHWQRAPRACAEPAMSVA